MADKKIAKQRWLLSITVVVSIMVMVMVTLLFFDIDARTVTDIVSIDNVAYVNVSTVYIPENYINIWNDRYESENTEFIYCLYGEPYQDNGYVVTEIKTTEVISKEEDSITYMKCDRNKRYLGNIHSHPQPESRYLRATCELSKQDIYTFGSEQQVLTGVICGENKIAIYGVGEFEHSFDIKIIEEDKIQ